MEQIINFINDLVWSPPLIILLVGAGLYFSIRTGFVQLRIATMVRSLFKKNEGKGKIRSISSFQAFCMSLSGRVGTGNIIGVATAIAFGGPGSIFWMWLIAFLGAATAFTEATLAQKYNFNYHGRTFGGPACYIEKGLKCPRLAVLFAVLSILGYGLLLVLVQANGIAISFENAFGVTPIISGTVLAITLGIVILGGFKRIANVAEIITPFMAIGYIVVSIIIICVNIQAVPGAFKLILCNAFGINPLVGGILGSTIAMGIKRGLFSNEAGQGGGAIISASASQDQPAKQGLVQAFSVYIDTLFVCTATALMIICSGKYNIYDKATDAIIYAGAPELGKNFVGYTQAAVDSVFNGFGSAFVSIALLFFVFTTYMAYSFYTESSLTYIFHSRGFRNARINKLIINVFKFIMMALVVVGTCCPSDTAWILGDIGIGLTTWINVIALLILFPQALAELKKLDNKSK